MLTIDIIWFVVSFIFGIVAAVRQSQISSSSKLGGGFGSASFFAFLCAILYLVHAILIFKNKMGAKS
jgi:surface polysaccharide O-acyltransferase-like enzyme